MEFSCVACSSPAVVFPDHLSDEAPIKCRRCGIVVFRLGEFRLYAGQSIRAALATKVGRQARNGEDADWHARVVPMVDHSAVAQKHPTGA
jgi:DNA-directed RNA polymerase subunit RPC12/RpoP